MAQPIKTTQPEAVAILRRLDALSLSQRDLAEALDLAENKVSKVRAGERRLQAGEVVKASRWLDEREAARHSLRPDLPTPPSEMAYVPIEVLPTYAGMGGGGTGEGDPRTALVPRSLIVDQLRGQPADFILIDVRGDSMEPDFSNGDQLLVDKRDVSPAQPGPFALWDGEWDEYVVKNVERLQSGIVRIFSSNEKYSPREAREDETRIIGRPVWFGRQL